ncbi:trans-sulfuration enzyme family protein [Dechloromonas denitrificans]|uniref:trans-sulfuration enzyme family protein n=1 Tax=Dechloromonas denitrificans TaxID=281362 RepID=UPI001CF84D2D|nr:PLP-dependent aspartate aminotransferase family protein [Dechloromonas denitrificans]UCV04086.1 PLP-dependent transferase [Dechloromonas denitrificans]UCV08348.1 PLP-dependent transferase [Dechloromonas denitrificans]
MSRIAPETLAAHGGSGITEPYRDIVQPIHLATTFERAEDGSYPGGRVYSRDQSPAYDSSEKLLAELEGGAQALLFASGMAAATAVLQALKPGDRILAPRSTYWAWRNWLRDFTSQWGIELALYANSDLADLERQLNAAPTQLLWIETPANPTWEITDIAAAAARAKAAGAKVVVDSTVATPVFTRPIELGADIVLHSATKYLNGHSDVVAGALVARATDDFWLRIRKARNLGGAVLGPFEAWLLQRGLRTLFLRVRTAAANAEKVALFLAGHPAVVEVLYPGLPGNPGYAVAARQMQGGFGAMLSVRIAGGESGSRAVAGKLKLFRQATSLGAVESLVEHRASVEGAGTLVPDDLLRLSIGIESAEDLIADWQQALA